MKEFCSFSNKARPVLHGVFKSYQEIRCNRISKDFPLSGCKYHNIKSSHYGEDE